MDPTHDRPIHPSVLTFMVRDAGFAAVETRFLHPRENFSQDESSNECPTDMAGELENLVTYLYELNLQGTYPRTRIHQALSLFMLCLPVYRIYPDKLPLRAASLELLDEAFHKALQLDPDFSEELNYVKSLCHADTTSEFDKSAKHPML